jgi:hypothetical protein
MPESAKSNRDAVSFEELAYSNMLVVQALVELLAEKGILSEQEVLGRVQKLKQEARVTSPRTQHLADDGEDTPEKVG